MTLIGVTFWERAALLPPILVRLLARHKWGPPLTDREIAEASGLSPWQVHLISCNTSWSGIDLPTMQRFLRGCDLDFEDRKRMRSVAAYLRHDPQFTYLQRSEQWKTLYQPMIEQWEAAMTRK